MMNFSTAIKTILVLAILLMLTACPAGRPTRADAQAMKNPVEATPESVASGKNVYDKNCTQCHGVAGKGVSEKEAVPPEAAGVKAADLTDDKWEHGSTDAEIFIIIRYGVPPKGALILDKGGTQAAMKGLDGKPGITDQDMWNVVNYIRTLPQ